jgi:hypothetical protein
MPQGIAKKRLTITTSKSVRGPQQKRMGRINSLSLKEK